MKRLAFILLATLMMAGNTSAQHKPTKGSWSTEVQINPFDQDGETFSLDGLKVRYFFNDKNAIRLKVGFATTNSKYTDKDSDEEKGSSRDNQYDYKKGNFNIDLGYERHFNLGKRLDAYLGGSIGLGKNFASTKIETYSKSTYNEYNGSRITETSYTGELKNGAITSSAGNNVFDQADRASWNINAAIFAGLDVYIYKGLYIGTELGIGCSSRKSLKMEFDATTISKVTSGGQTTTTEDTIDEETTDNYRTTNFKTYIEPRLRIGITF
ncbi:hypothetical protein [uncultured Bacteroides sp.]|uniref:hypothetical protein n=1 Tax=uncultured Bacteroides sp. TaxID=162156 RepID=UPI0026008862|nr:hypothetical protein [uncultured Bacteroides sp.]